MTRERLVSWAVRGSLFLLPAVAVSVEHGASAVFGLLVLLGVLFGWPGRRRVSAGERTFLWGLAGFCALMGVAALASDSLSEGLGKLERFVRFLWFVPAYLLMRHNRLPCGRTLAAGVLVAAPLLFAQAIYQTRCSRFLFKMEEGLTLTLGEGGIPEDVRREFRSHGISFSPSARVSLPGKRDTWTIVDGRHKYLLSRRQGDTHVTKLPFTRARGAYNPILFGDFCVYMTGVIGAWLVCVARRRPEYAAGLCAALLALYTSLLSGSRGAWICIPALLLLFLALYARRLGKRQWALGGAGLLLVAILAFLVFPDHARSRLVELKTGISSPSQVLNVHLRLEMWKACLTIFGRSPLLGTGLGDLQADMRQLIAQGAVDMPSAFDHAHSIYFDMLARAGLAGTAGLVVLVFVLPFRAFFLAWRRSSAPWAEFSALAGMLTVASFAVFGLTEAWFSRMPLATAYVVCLMTFLASAMNEAELAEGRNTHTNER